ncbi:MAG: rhodanese-like domain-containing protein [Hyphomicrobiales bacterium]
MKKSIFTILLLFLLLNPFDLSLAVSGATPEDPPISGSIAGGFRVLEVPENSRDLKLTVYRGDYIKFKLEGAIGEPILSVPDLSIRQKLSADVEGSPYFKMEKTGEFPFALGALKGIITVIDYQRANYQEVTPKEAAELIQNIQPLILDVRTPVEYSRGHLRDSVLLPLQQLQNRWQDIAAHRDQDVLIYCATGNRSTVAAKILIDHGFKRIFNLRQGISGWEREQYPVVK